MANVGYATLQVIPSFRGAGSQLSSGINGLAPSVSAPASRLGTAFGGRFSSLAGSSIARGLTGVFAGLGIATLVRGAFNEAQEAIKVGAQTEQVIESTGGAANVTAGYVADLSEALSMKVGQDDEAIQSGANLLLTFKNIRNEVGEGNDIFDQATGLALDLSAALDQDMKSSALQLGKALNDPIKGVTALGRAGVQFTEDQKEQIKTMVEAGDVLGAQKLILAEIESQVGGSAEAQVTAADKMSVAWANLQETIGLLLMPVFESVAGFITTKLIPAMDWLTGNTVGLAALGAVAGGVLLIALLGATLAMWNFAAATLAATWPILAILAAIALLTAAVILVWTHWDQIWNYIKDHPAYAAILALLFPVAAWFIAGVGIIRFFAQNWTTIWNTVRNVVSAAWSFIKPILDRIIPILEAIVTFFDALVHGQWSDAWEAFKQIVVLAWQAVWAAIQFVWSAIWGFVQTIPGLIVGALAALPGMLFEAGRAGFQGMFDGAVQVAFGLVGWVTTIPGAIVSALGDLSNILFDIGKSIFQGLWDGMKSIWESTTGWLSGLNPADWKGPPARDRVMLIGAGELIMEGLREGMASEWAKTAKWLTTIDPSAAVSAGSFEGGRLNASAMRASRSLQEVNGRSLTLNIAGDVTDYDGLVNTVVRIASALDDDVALDDAMSMRANRASVGR